MTTDKVITIELSESDAEYWAAIDVAGLEPQSLAGRLRASCKKALAEASTVGEAQ